MSELDQDGAKSLADNEDTDSIETTIEDNDEVVSVAEPTDRTAFQAELRSFLQLFNVTRDQLLFKIITDERWEQSNDLWKSMYKQPPKRNYQTVLEIYQYMKRITTGLIWDDANAEALDHAVFDTPKISKPILEKMCAVTKVQYTSPEKDIDLIQMLVNLIDLGIAGASKMCSIMDAYFELVTVSDNLDSDIQSLKTIISKVNTKRKTRRDAKILADSYANGIIMWESTINKAIIDEIKINEYVPLLKLAGYTGAVMHMDEKELIAVLSSFKTDKLDVTLFSSKRKVEIDDMKGVVENIEAIEATLLTIEEWTNPQTREPLAPPPPAVRPRIDTTPQRPQQRTNVNSSRKIIQRFTFQFRALGAMINETGMEPAQVDQAEAMLKALDLMRSKLDSLEDVEFETVVIDDRTYNISETLIDWMKTIYKSKDKNKKREKKEDRLKMDKMKRLLEYSKEFPTKLEDDSSILGFMCHLIRMEPLLPSGEDEAFLDEPALVANIKNNILRQDDIRATSKFETLCEITQYLTNMYLSNPTFLKLVFKPIYTMRKPFNNRDAINNINAVQNLLSSVKLANLIEQISGTDLQEMINKCILLRRLDAYTTAWLTHSQDLEKEEPHDGDVTSVGKALKSLSVGVNALKQASLVLSQVNFFL